jgi:replicative DNA helicase
MNDYLERKMDFDFSYETGLIGSIIINGEYMAKVMDIVAPDDFYNHHCKAAYAAALEIYTTGRTVDPLTIIEELNKSGDSREDLSLWVRDLMLETPTAHNAEVYALGIRNKARLRRIKELLEDVTEGVSNPDELTDKVIDGLLAIERGSKGKTARLGECLMEFKEWALAKDDNRRLDTGYSRLDGLLHGMFPGNLIILAARPAVGKSALACELALRLSEKGLSAAIFSCEMEKNEIIQRYISSRASIKLDDITDKTFHEDEAMELKIVNAMREISSYPLYINDSSGITVSDIRKTLQTIRDIRLVVVDYLQILTPHGKSENRNIEVSNMTRALKQLAKEYQVPIIALSQLNRGKDENDEPSLRDLRESGAIEQDADKVIFLWKVDTPEYEVQRIGVKVAKNRMSKTGTVVMQFAGEQMRFAETYDEYVPKKKGRSRQFYPVNDADIPSEWR